LFLLSFFVGFALFCLRCSDLEQNLSDFVFLFSDKIPRILVAVFVGGTTEKKKLVAFLEFNHF
jgi:hypothetical protein